ncbi:hypothetical protein [Edaphobacillus lindanitolerans]|uniref:Uncharacterized protein n=1 Tax=Edaphobacillus lindanitolerans TaxID=550447 RepID=A0A1U7PT81_9BACI|nr:hypothetical protein [Edaphobacillus lindanitolerans]SIT91607.1 hypothetical protein SAMN05428946_2711 [Edaphobacillus lindanitolerans]
MNADIIDLIKSFEGIIGAVLGSVLTLITTHLLKKAGGLTSNINIDNVNITEDKDGFFKNVESLKEADHAKVELVVDFYNSSEIYKSISDIKVDFYDGKKLIYSIPLSDSDTRKTGKIFTAFDEFEYLNVAPNELVKKKLFFEFNQNNIEILKITTHFSIRYSIHKNSAKRKREIKKKFFIDF